MRGRPRLRERERRSYTLPVRLTQAEAKAIRDLARARGIRVSEWVRRRILEVEQLK